MPSMSRLAAPLLGYCAVLSGAPAAEAAQGSPGLYSLLLENDATGQPPAATNTSSTARMMAGPSSVARAVAALRGRVGMLAAENKQLMAEAQQNKKVAGTDEQSLDALRRQLLDTHKQEEAVKKDAAAEQSRFDEDLKSQSKKANELRARVSEEEKLLTEEKAKNGKEVNEGLTLVKQTKALNAKLAKMEKDFARKLKGEQQAKEKEIGGLKAKFQKEEAAALNKAFQQQEAEEKELNATYETVKEEKAENDKLSKTVDDLDSQANILRPEVARLQSSYSDSKASMKSMHEELDRLNKENAVFKSSIAKFDAHKQASDKERDQLRAELAELREKAQDLDEKKKDTKSMHDEMSKLSETIAGLKRDKDGLAERLRVTTEEDKKLNETLQKTTEENRALYREAKQERERVVSQRNGTMAELNALRAKAAELQKVEQEKEALQQELEALKLKVKQSDETMNLVGMAGNAEAEEVVKEALKEYISKQEISSTTAPATPEEETNAELQGLQNLASDSREVSSSMQRLASKEEDEEQEATNGQDDGGEDE